LKVVSAAFTAVKRRYLIKSTSTRRDWGSGLRV